MSKEQGEAESPWRSTEYVTAYYGMSEAKMYRLISKGLFPKPSCIGERQNAWHVDTINAFDKQLLDASK